MFVNYIHSILIIFLISFVVVYKSFAQTISVSGSNTLYIKNDGSLWGVGRFWDGGSLVFHSVSDPLLIQNNDVVKVEFGSRGTFIFLKKDGSVWGMGENEFGELGDGSRTRRSEVINIFTNNIKDFSIGSFCSLFLTQDDDVFTAGRNGWLFRYDTDEDATYGRITKLDHPNRSEWKIKQLETNLKTAVYLDENGSVISLAKPYGIYKRYNSFNAEEKDIENYFLTLRNASHVNLQYEGNWMLCIDKNNVVWGIGAGRNGQLGQGTFLNEDQLTKVESVNGIIKTATGRVFSMLLKNDGSLWLMGESSFGKFSVPEKIVDEGVVDIASNGYAAIFLKSDGSLWDLFGSDIVSSHKDQSNNLEFRLIAQDVKIPSAEKVEKDLRDNDSDGLNNYEEISQYFTNPNKSDSDEDGIMDGQEINLGLNPNISDKALIDFISSNFQLTDDINQTKIYESGKADGIKEVQNQPSNFGLVAKSTYQQVPSPSPSSSKSTNEIESTPYTLGWFYSPDAGWLWTNSKAFPHFFEASSSKWIYFKEGSDPSLFFDYDLNTWSSLKELPYKRWVSSFNDWKKEPEKYGGEYVLEKVQEAYENNSTELLLSSKKILDLTPVASLRKLTRLFLSNVELSDVSSLSKLNNLEYLNLEINQISDIRALSNLTNLKYLNLQQNKIEDISALSKLNNLKELYLGFNFDLVSVLPLKNLDNLEVLGLENAIRKSSDVATIAELKKLKDLKLTYNKLEDISWIADLTEMEKLYLSYNSLKDLSALKKLNRMDTLFLEQNSDLNIKAIPDLYNLKRLYFGKNNLRNLNSINRFTQLEDLGLSSNNLSDVKELHDLKNLVNLSLSSNPLSESQVSELEDNLPRVIKVNF